MMPDEVLAAVRLLSGPGGVVEVRAITGNGVASGYFNSPEILAKRADMLDKDPDVQGVYVTLNQVDRALFSRRANRVKMRLSKKDATTADGDITRRLWLPVDIDPVRPSGVFSTDEEHRAALERAGQVAAFLAGDCGWPGPVLADSGNGAHLLYRVDLPNDDESRDLVKRCLEVLASRFSDERATVDTANYNAARIWKLYGTFSRKGDHTPERPHRRSRVLQVPDPLLTVSREVLAHLAGLLPAAPPGETQARPSRGNHHPSDLRTWLSDHGIGWSSEKPYKGGTLYTLDQCPFSDAHRDGAYAIQFPSGAVHVACHHQSCGGGKQRWPELRERYGPVPGPGAKNPPRPPGPVIPVPSVTRREDNEVPGAMALPEKPAEPGVSAEALSILREGDPKRFMLETFAGDHVGDMAVAECLVLSLASRSVVNTNGLHISITGESGKGKSHAVSTMLRLVPERFRLEGAMSNKALFYMDGLVPGSVIVLDDRALSEEMAEILKGVTTSFQKPFVYRTVNRDRHGQVCTIPERCVWWVAKVEGAGDDQVFNRMLTCWIDDTPEQDDRVLEQILKQNEAPPPRDTGDRQEVLVCRAMWEILAQNQGRVVIPFASRIRFQAHANRRNPEMLLDLIKANALLMTMQRERHDHQGSVCITATVGDFNEAIRLYSLLNGTSGGQTTKLTRKESELVTVISRQKWEEFTIPMLQKVTGYSNGALHRVLHGYVSRGSVYSGLLEKCPAISYTDRTLLTEDMETGDMVRRRTNAYTFDQELYGSWASGTAVWIEADRDPVHEGPGPGGDGDQDRSSFSPSAQNSSPSTGTEGQKKAVADPGLTINPSKKHLDERDQMSSSKMKYAEVSDPVSVPPPLCVYKPDIAGGEYANNDNQHLIDDPILQMAGNTLQNQYRAAEGVPGAGDEKCPETSTTVVPVNERVQNESGGQPPAAAGHTRRVSARDYKLLDRFEARAPCHVCGRRGASYVEKLTKERLSRPKGDQDARRICRQCYEAAARRDRVSAPLLPGVINPAAFVRLTRAVGKCSVCHLGAAAWRDPGADLDLCEACYSRESRLQAEAGS